MTPTGIAQIVFYMACLVAIAKPLGIYIARVFQRERTFLDPVLGPVERLIYRCTRINPDQEMGWKENAVAMLLFNLAGFLVLYLVQRIQQWLPLNPQGFGPVTPDSSFNTAVSFVTNTNWQGYSGETTMSYLTQMIGMTKQNFTSAATGLALLALIIRGFSRHSAKTLGNFWVDLTRSTLYILLPLALVLSLVLVSQGASQNFSPYVNARFLQPAVDTSGARVKDQVIALGPVASQVAIKHQIGRVSCRERV